MFSISTQSALMNQHIYECIYYQCPNHLMGIVECFIPAACSVSVSPFVLSPWDSGGNLCVCSIGVQDLLCICLNCHHKIETSVNPYTCKTSLRWSTSSGDVAIYRDQSLVRLQLNVHPSIFNEPRAIMPLNLTLSYRAITETDSYYYHVLIKSLTNACNEFNQYVAILIWQNVMLKYTFKTIIILIIKPVIDMLKKRDLTSSQPDRPIIILSIPLNNFQSTQHTVLISYSFSAMLCNMLPMISNQTTMWLDFCGGLTL